MEIKSYLGDLESAADDMKRISVAADGRRLEEHIRVHNLDDGSVEHVHEIKEEVVPMRLSRRVVRKIAQVPVEERIESIGEDGSVQTILKSLGKDRLDLDLNERVDPNAAMTAQLANEVRSLASAIVDLKKANEVRQKVVSDFAGAELKCSGYDGKCDPICVCGPDCDCYSQSKIMAKEPDSVPSTRANFVDKARAKYNPAVRKVVEPIDLDPAPVPTPDAPAEKKSIVNEKSMTIFSILVVIVVAAAVSVSLF